MTSWIRIQEVAAASVATPPAGRSSFFIDSADTHAKTKNSSGTVTDLTEVGSKLVDVAGTTSLDVDTGIGGNIDFESVGSIIWRMNSLGDLTAQYNSELRFLEDPANGSNSVGFQAPASIAADVTWTLPDADGAVDSVLQTNGAGVLSWVPNVKKVNFNPLWDRVFDDFTVVEVGDGNVCHIPTFIPNDFAALDGVEIIGFARDAASVGVGKDCDLTHYYAAINSDKKTNSETDTTTTYTIPAVGAFFALDISSVFASVSAGDQGSLLFTNNTGGRLEIIRIEFRYTA